MRGLVLLASLFATSAVSAEDDMASALRLSGFGTLGAVYANQDTLHPLREVGAPSTFSGNWSWRMDSLLGVQLNARLSPDLDAAVQVVARERAARNLNESLEWAYLSWQPDPRIKLRLGRLGLDFYLLSDCRNVSYAYLWERPPVEFYGLSLPPHFDGVDASYLLRLGDGVLTAKIFAGWNARTISLGDSVGDDRIEQRPLWGGRVSYLQRPWLLSAGFGRLTFSEDLETLTRYGVLQGLESGLVQLAWPQATYYADDVRNEGRSLVFYSLGASFDNALWQVSAEMSYLSSDWSPLRDTLIGYLSVGRRFGSLTPYVLVSSARPQESVETFSAPSNLALAYSSELALLSYLVQDLYQNSGADQTTLSAGVRWDIRPKLAMKLQWDQTHVRSGQLFESEELFESIRDEHVNLFSLSLNWIF